MSAAIRSLPTPGTTARLWAAAGLCFVPLGLVWSATVGFLAGSTTLFGTCDVDGYCTPDIFIPGYYLPGSHALGGGAPVRIFLLFAAVALGYCATRTRTAPTRRVARLATAAIALTAVLAAANRVSIVLICMIAAFALVAPPAWSRAAPGQAMRAGAFGERNLRR